MRVSLSGLDAIALITILMRREEEHIGYILLTYVDPNPYAYRNRSQPPQIRIPEPTAKKWVDRELSTRTRIQVFDTPDSPPRRASVMTKNRTTSMEIIWSGGLVQIIQSWA